MRRGFWLVAVLAVASLAGVGILTRARNASPRDTQATEDVRVADQGPAVTDVGSSAKVVPDGDRRPAPDFTVRTTSGRTFALAEARDRLVVMSFLAPGCADCTAEVEALKAVHEQRGSSGVDVLLVDVGGVTDAELLEYYRDSLGGGDHLYAEDTGFSIATAYELKLLGTTVVVDRAGRIAFRDEELTPAPRLISVVDQLLKEA